MPLWTAKVCPIISGEIIDRRHRIFEGYRQRLDGVTGIGFQPIAEWAECAPWLFSVTVDQAAYGVSRDDLMSRLGDAGVDTRPFFIPLHTLPPFRDQARERGEVLPVTDDLGAIGLNLPTFSALKEAELDYICDVIRKNAAA